MGRPVHHDAVSEATRTVASPDRCVHCGLPLAANHRPEDGPFCCAGCRTVHDLINASGLDRFYDLRPSRIAPASDLRPDNLAWLDLMLEDPAVRLGQGGIVRLALDIQGVHCAACVWLLEELFRRRPGGRSLTINPALGTADLVWDTEAGDLGEYVTEAERFGYRFGPARKDRRSVSRGVQVRMGVCIAAAMNVMMYSLAYYFGLTPTDGTAYVLFGWIIAGLSTVCLVVGGWPFVANAWRGLRRGVVHLDLPIALGMVLGYAGSLQAYLRVGPHAAYFDTIAVFIALMLVGRWLQEHVLERNRNALLTSGGIADLHARRIEDGEPRAVPAADLRSGDELWIAPGDLVPVEGVVLHRDVRVSLDWITGESRPEDLAPGDRVPAGAFNAGEEGFRLAAVESFSASRLHDLLRADSGPVDGPTERGWWHRVGTVYVLTVIVLAVVAFTSWAGRDGRKAVEVTVAVLVVTCPCALGLALPLGRELVHASLRRSGVLLRRDAFLDRALQVRKILFDKTGTLTRGQLALTEDARRSLLRLPADKRKVLWNMTARSNHPVSRATAAALGLSAVEPEAEGDLGLDAVFDDVREMAGAGLEAVVESGTWRFGRAAFACPDRDIEAGDATVFSLDGFPVLEVRFHEELKGDAADEVRLLEDDGFEVHLLSGDAPERADAAAERLGLDPARVRGGLSPEAKADAVRGLDARDTLMIGDGLNDSPSFDAAFAAATPAVDRAVLPQKADFYYLGDGVAAVRRTLVAARRLRRIQNGNLVFAAVYNAAAVGLCFAGLVTPVVAAIIMPVSSVTVVTITAMRLSSGRSAWTS